MNLTYNTPLGEIDYEVTPTESDYVNYYFEMYIGYPKGMKDEDKAMYRKGAIAVLHELYTGGDYLEDALEDNDDFRDYVKERHEREVYDSLQ